MTKSTSKLFQSEEAKPMSEDAMNLPQREETENEKTENIQEKKPVVNDDVQDIDLSVTAKKRFRINGDNNKILLLNTSDINAISRLDEAYRRLNKYMDEVGKLLESTPDNSEDLTEEQRDAINEQLNAIDSKMKSELDFIFDAPVSEICGDGGSMYDPFEGMFRFEHIIDALTKLYENNLNSEFDKMRRRVAKKTGKYTKHYHN